MATGGAAAIIFATAVFGEGTTLFAVSDMAEGIDNYEKAPNGDLSEGHNFMRDDVFRGNEFAYNLVKTGVEILRWEEVFVNSNNNDIRYKIHQ